MESTTYTAIARALARGIVSTYEGDAAVEKAQELHDLLFDLAMSRDADARLDGDRRIELRARRDSAMLDALASAFEEAAF